jgi:hypothetical protein
MTAKVPTKLAASIVLLLGAALPASAQQPSETFERVGCYIDLTEVDGVPSEPTNFQARFTTTDSVVNCPGNRPVPNIQVECRLLIGPNWPAGLKVNTRRHDCKIDGAQCGFPEEFESDNTHLLIEPVVIDGEVFGDAQLRCMNRDND